jgi:hypothetical protein
MNEDRFDDLMRDAAQTFRAPPSPDFEAMWKGIEMEAFGASSEPRSSLVSRRSSRVTQRLAIAATLVIGIALGRASMSLGTKTTPAPTQTVASIANTVSDVPYEVETSKYLGQTAALLIALPSEVKAGRADEAFVGRAGELLGRTRLLLDSPASRDPQMKTLLEDLELVLAQVVRLQNDSTSRSELDRIARALEQRDVLPRLRSAVADISAISAN